jgi:hypothetical protein
MKLNLFFKRKDKEKKVDEATDFLNPADLESLKDLKKIKKFKKNNKKKNKKEINKKRDKKIKKEERKKTEVAEKIKKEEKRKEERKEKIKNRKNRKNRKRFINKKKKIEDIDLDDESPVELVSPIEKIDEVTEKYKKTIKEKKKENKSKEPVVFSKRKIQEVENKIDRKDLLDKADILEINLAKDQVSIFFDWYKNLAFLFVLAFLCFLFVIEIYLGLSWWQNYNQNANNYKYEDFNLIKLSTDLRSTREDVDEALIFQEKLNKVAYLLNNHIYWTSFFDYLENNTLEGVKYVQFEGDLSGKYSLNSVADIYPLIGRQTDKYLESENVSLALVNSAVLQETEDEENGTMNSFVTFTTELTINPEIFKK